MEKTSCLGLMEAATLGRGQLKEETCLVGTVVWIPHTPPNLSFSPVLSSRWGRTPPSPEAANATELPLCWLSAV